MDSLEIAKNKSEELIVNQPENLMVYYLLCKIYGSLGEYEKSLMMCSIYEEKTDYIYDLSNVYGFAHAMLG